MHSRNTHPLLELLSRHAQNDDLVRVFTTAGSFTGMLREPDEWAGLVVLNEHRRTGFGADRLSRELTLVLDSIQGVTAYRLGFSPPDTIPWD